MASTPAGLQASTTGGDGAGPALPGTVTAAQSGAERQGDSHQTLGYSDLIFSSPSLFNKYPLQTIPEDPREHREAVNLQTDKEHLLWSLLLLTRSFCFSSNGCLYTWSHCKRLSSVSSKPRQAMLKFYKTQNYEGPLCQGMDPWRDEIWKP